MLGASDVKEVLGSPEEPPTGQALYPPMKESEALRPQTSHTADFISTDLDTKRWVSSFNGISRGFAFPAGDRFRVSPGSQALDKFYETDRGLAHTVSRMGYSRRETTFGQTNRPPPGGRPRTSASVDVPGPGSYFNDPRLLASPIRARAMTASLQKVLRSTDAPDKLGRTVGATGLAIAQPAAVVRPGVTKEDLNKVVMHHSRRMKHLQQRRVHKKSTGQSDPLIEPLVYQARNWTHRTIGMDGLSISKKGPIIPTSSRFKPARMSDGPGPGQYPIKGCFGVTKPVFKIKAEDKFPTRRR